MSTTLLDLGTKITVYGSFFFIVIGLFGNGMMIFIFSSVRISRRTPCTFYFLIGSICNVLYISINLPIRILNIGYGNDITTLSPFLCKGRTFMTSWTALTSFTCSCLAIIDQFLVTSRSATLRRSSQIKWAHRIVLIAITIWFIYALPAFIFLDISPATKTCLITNRNYGTYISIYILVLISAIPILVMLVFGYLTYRNVHQTIVLTGQHVDRLMITMTFIEVILIVISNSPYGIIYAYTLITAGVLKSVNRLIREVFVTLMFSLISYFYYVGNFYMFFILSTRFRQGVKERILGRNRTNEIVPIRQIHL